MKEILNNDLKQKAEKIKYFFCDIDGTLTDGGVYYSLKGEELKRFNLRDGTGFFLLKQVGIKSGFITTENSPIVAKRAEKLGIDKYIFGTKQKLNTIKDFLIGQSLSLENIAFIGDEINDVHLLKNCGIAFAVADADDRVKSVADYVCSRNGGQGAFREAVEVLLMMKGIDIDAIIERLL